MAANEANAAAREALYADPERHDRYVSAAAEALLKTGAEAAEWIDAMFDANRRDLVEIVCEGVLIEAGCLYHPEEPPQRLEAVTKG